MWSLTNISAKLLSANVARGLHRLIPAAPVQRPFKKEGDTNRGQPFSLTPAAVEHLERTSLVSFDGPEAVARLEEAVAFAAPLREVDVEGVEPLYTVLEDRALRLREDEAGETSRRDAIGNAAKIEEDYFVAPPGNIPIKVEGAKQRLFEEKKAKVQGARVSAE